MLRHFSPTTRRLFLSPVHSSSSSKTPCPFIVRCSHISSSSNSNSSNALSLSRRLEEKSLNVKAKVWWDFDTCKLPTRVSVLKVAPIITAVLKANGIKGPIEISAFGNIWKLSPEQHPGDIFRSGIDFNCIPTDERHSGRWVSRCILSSLKDWVFENPPPAHLFLISNDSDIADILQHRRMDNYNILVANTGIGMDMDVLNSEATISWNWYSMITGRRIIGRRRKFPPDGLNDSWYGHLE